ncbi:hypothetical protein [Pectinatus frisingensis]|uniref:hypothetical protein n=1 Tax=Pectinatus frisingensis TaxID=865 RepID=UPI0015F578B8|nr:hypothetical protein [Pectinatus frisingensis]
MFRRFNWSIWVLEDTHCIPDKISANCSALVVLRYTLYSSTLEGSFWVSDSYKVERKIITHSNILKNDLGVKWFRRV